MSVQITPAPQALDGFIPAVGVYVDGNLHNNEPIAADGSAVSSLSLAAGSHEVYASFSGFNDYEASQSAAITIEVGSATTTDLTSSRERALNTQDVTYTATVTGKNGYPQPADPPVGGTLTITDTTTSAVLETLAVTATAHTLAVTKKLSVGSHALKATYSGDGLYRASSALLTETIQADRVVDAAGVSSTPTTFYPVVDTYKDTLTIRGSRREPIAVAIRICSVSTGKLVRAASIALGSGAYSWSWNGRYHRRRPHAGRELPDRPDPDGYRLESLAVTTTAALSHKRLYWHTATVTKYGDAYSVKGDPGTGSVSRSASGYYRGVRLASGRSWVAVSYPFTIPSATVYGTFTFKVLGRSTNGTRATSAIWNPDWGSYLYVESYGAPKLIGPTYRWWSTSGPGSAFHSGRTARAEVFLECGPGAKVFDMAKVSMVVRYALLR